MYIYIYICIYIYIYIHTYIYMYVRMILCNFVCACLSHARLTDTDCFRGNGTFKGVRQ